jgi:hypothetical protein
LFRADVCRYCCVDTVSCRVYILVACAPLFGNQLAICIAVDIGQVVLWFIACGTETLSACFYKVSVCTVANTSSGSTETCWCRPTFLAARLAGNIVVITVFTFQASVCRCCSSLLCIPSDRALGWIIGCSWAVMTYWAGLTIVYGFHCRQSTVGPTIANVAGRAVKANVRDDFCWVQTPAAILAAWSLIKVIKSTWAVCTIRTGSRLWAAIFTISAEGTLQISIRSAWAIIASWAYNHSTTRSGAVEARHTVDRLNSSWWAVRARRTHIWNYSCLFRAVVSWHASEASSNIPIQCVSHWCTFDSSLLGSERSCVTCFSNVRIFWTEIAGRAKEILESSYPCLVTSCASRARFTVFIGFRLGICVISSFWTGTGLGKSSWTKVAGWTSLHNRAWNIPDAVIARQTQSAAIFALRSR